MRPAFVLIAAALLLALPAAPAHAYLDPGTGSYVVQVVIAALVSVSFVVRVYWRKLRGLFTRRNEPRPPAQTDER